MTSTRHCRLSSSTSTRRATRARRAGYTMIEVMMALGILASGAVGLMALQQASTRGNMEAREMGTGTLVAQRWLERLRHDGLGWTRGTPGVEDPTLLTNTQYLRAVPGAGGVAPWFVPGVSPTSGHSSSADYYGNDTTVPGDMRFCTNVRLEWLHLGRAMRADVRVWWLRRAGGTDDPGRAALAQCAPGADPGALTADPRLRMVYASTVLRFNP